MPFNTTPSLGIDLDRIDTSPAFRLLNTVESNDGRKYIYVQASAAISAAASPGTEVTLTEPAGTAAAGAGGFRAPVAGVSSGSYFWARKGAL